MLINLGPPSLIPASTSLLFFLLRQLPCHCFLASIRLLSHSYMFSSFIAGGVYNNIRRPSWDLRSILDSELLLLIESVVVL
jgi:hypothetical protein